MSPEELNTLAKYTAELSAAAKLDWLTANPAEVGLNGISIIHWREAYFEGCKDMANKVFNGLPKAIQGDFANAFKSAMDAEIERLKTSAE